MATDSLNIEVDGLADLEKQLLKLERKVASKKLRGALSKAANPVVRSAKSKTPVDTGALRQSIGKALRTGRGKNFASVFIGPKPKNKTAIALANNAGRKIKGIFYGHMVELGNTYPGVEQKPQPYLRPALDEQADNATRIFSTELKKDLESVARK